MLIYLCFSLKTLNLFFIVLALFIFIVIGSAIIILNPPYIDNSNIQENLNHKMSKEDVFKKYKQSFENVIETIFENINIFLDPIFIRKISQIKIILGKIVNFISLHYKLLFLLYKNIYSYLLISVINLFVTLAQ